MRNIDAKCPYCGFVNKVHINDWSGKRLIACDCEAGGCDEDFVIHWRTAIEHDIYKLIEPTVKNKSEKVHPSADFGY